MTWLTNIVTDLRERADDEIVGGRPTGLSTLLTEAADRIQDLEFQVQAMESVRKGDNKNLLARIEELKKESARWETAYLEEWKACVDKDEKIRELEQTLAAVAPAAREHAEWRVAQDRRIAASSEQRGRDESGSGWKIIRSGGQSDG